MIVSQPRKPEASAVHLDYCVTELPSLYAHRQLLPRVAGCSLPCFPFCCHVPKPNRFPVWRCNSFPPGGLLFFSHLYFLYSGSGEGLIVAPQFLVKRPIYFDSEHPACLLAGGIFFLFGGSIVPACILCPVLSSCFRLRRKYSVLQNHDQCRGRSAGLLFMCTVLGMY